MGGTVGSTIASVTDPDVAVPSVPVGVTQVAFDVPFDFKADHLVLPTAIVYGITIDSNPTGNLNIGLAPNVATGSDVYPGDIYVSTTAGNLAALETGIGTCSGNDLASDPTSFQAVPVMCSSGYGGQNTEGTAGVLMKGRDGTYNGDVSENAGYQGTDQVPVIPVPDRLVVVVTPLS